MSENIKEDVSRRSIWLRLVFMIVLCVAYGVAEVITLDEVVFKFIERLI